jgi:very-short-patch-repair endonuclease
MNDAAVQRARKLRKEMTPQEIALWLQLRSLRAEGWHFRRQSPEPPYTLDFVCRRAKLVVEVDGAQHAAPDQTRHDDARDALLHKRGFRILRFWAGDIERELDGVMQTVRSALGESPNSPRFSVPPSNKAGRRYRSVVRLGLRIAGMDKDGSSNGG